MGEFRSNDKSRKLQLLYAQQKPRGKKLSELLLEALQTCEDAISSSGSAPGTWLSSTSENGGSSSFSMLYDLSPTVAARIMTEILKEWRKAKSILTSRLEEEPTEQQIYDFMMSVYDNPVRRYRSDFTSGRYGIGYHLGTS